MGGPVTRKSLLENKCPRTKIIRKFWSGRLKYSVRGCILNCRQHGNAHRIPVHAFKADDVQKVVEFITNYAEDNAILLPGRIPGYKKTDIQLIPSSTTKNLVWCAYVQAAEDLPVRVAGYKSFRNIWNQFVPLIVVTKPASDLCWVCQQNSTLIMRSANKSEEEKSEVSLIKLLV